MKALLGELGKVLLRDENGAKELRRFATDGKEVKVVSVQGKKYIISTKPLNAEEVRDEFDSYFKESEHSSRAVL